MIPVRFLEVNEKLFIKDEKFDVRRGIIEGKKRQGQKRLPVITKHQIVNEENKGIQCIDFSNFMCNTIDILRKENAGARTWKEKLELVDRIIKTVELENKELAAIGGYLQLINNGQIRCQDDGTHYRTSRHATIALNMYGPLIKIINDENAFHIKTILRNLPSFNSKFRSDVPLNRIRDIAHRDDIPTDLKAEIKSTLQNKLHSNASPEDLVTAQNLLIKIKAYSLAHIP
eukprot:TRINITY_DN9331_c0_g1_i4.p1 TRINITY_DN9331_c0_g1~~TRINITY_DN9331_c0_g1_i4.p1  ORF type:complete len:230 (-),score=69.33 TRINITY_DN9331_c0_g1_i4:2393-3082(-)